jgi:hypothetical protein
MTVTFDQIDAFLRAALFAMEHRFPEAAEVSQLADDLREQHPARADLHPVPTQAGGRAMIRAATLAALAVLLTAPAMAACPAITSDTDPCWAAQVIQSEKERPAAADEWTPESFARTFGQTIASLTDAGQRMLHQCNPTFCEDVITDGKTVAYRDTSAGKPDLSSVCYAVQGSPEIRKCLYNSGEKTLEIHHYHEWSTLTVLVRQFDVAAPAPFAQQPATNAAHGE